MASGLATLAQKGYNLGQTDDVSRPGHKEGYATVSQPVHEPNPGLSIKGGSSALGDLFRDIFANQEAFKLSTTHQKTEGSAVKGDSSALGDLFRDIFANQEAFKLSTTHQKTEGSAVKGDSSALGDLFRDIFANQEAFKLSTTHQKTEGSAVPDAPVPPPTSVGDSAVSYGDVLQQLTQTLNHQGLMLG